MKYGIYVVYDTKAEAPLVMGPQGLHLFPHDAVAIRFFSDLVNDKQTMIHRHPEDYVLKELGFMDDQAIAASAPRVVVTATALVASQEVAS